MFQGEQIRLQNIQAFGQIGPPLFTALLPDGTMYLVYYQEGYMVEPGAYINVVGNVQTLDESVLNEWQETGVFTDPSQREDAALSETYIEADAVGEATPEEDEEEDPAADTAGEPGGQN